MARQKIICLSNDHKAIMKKIETILIHLHAQQDNQTEDANSSRTAQPMEQDLPEPFAKVEFVNIGSPAHDCGMRAGDLVVEFGTQNNSNFKSLMDIGQLVQNSQNRNVRIKLIRNRQLVTLNLVPKLWQGVGLLGKQHKQFIRLIIAWHAAHREKKKKNTFTKFFSIIYQYHQLLTELSCKSGTS